MTYTNGIGSPQNPFAAENPATSPASQTERTASVSLSGGQQNTASITGASDQTRVSAFGGALSQALNQSDVRMDRVSSLQQAIASGTYNIPASAVAEKLMGVLLA